MLCANAPGLARPDIYLFQVQATSNYFFSSSSYTDPAGFCRPKTACLKTHSLFNEIHNTCPRSSKRTIRFNAADIDVRAVYNVSLWGYCHTPQNGSQVCSKSRLNWAEAPLNAAKRNVEDWINAKDPHIALPERFTDMIREFSLWTLLAEAFSVIAVMALSAELFFGMFATRSLAVSCATSLVACVATVAVYVTAFAATLMLVVSAFSIDFGVITSSWFLALPISAVFAIAACVSWLFTTCCCCAPDNGSRQRGRDHKSEILVPSNSYEAQAQHPTLGPQLR
jgi:hypothetical protein